MARYWMHVGLTLRKGKKMSRSAGNALTLRDLLGRGYSGSQVRYFLLQTHYRRQLEFSFARLDSACKELARLNAVIKNLRQVRGGEGSHKVVDDMVCDADRDLFAALHDDLNVPRARACVFELLKRINKHMTSFPFSQCDAQLALDFLYRADRILCVLDFSQPTLLDDHANLLIDERNVARESGDYTRADALRQELEALGVAVDDTPGGSRVRTPK
jgi:cysteinyl-tRNA synthetase